MSFLRAQKQPFDFPTRLVVYDILAQTQLRGQKQQLDFPTRMVVVHDILAQTQPWFDDNPSTPSPTRQHGFPRRMSLNRRRTSGNTPFVKPGATYGGGAGNPQHSRQSRW